MTDHTVALNSADCIKSMMHFGFSRIHNICSGTIVDVPWGMMDWVMAMALIGFFLTAGIMMMSLGLLVLKEFWDSWR